MQFILPVIGWGQMRGRGLRKELPESGTHLPDLLVRCDTAKNRRDLADIFADRGDEFSVARIEIVEPVVLPESLGFGGIDLASLLPLRDRSPFTQNFRKLSKNFGCLGCRGLQFDDTKEFNQLSA